MEVILKKMKMSLDRCKGCYLCLDYCPKKAISLSDYTNSKGYVTVKVDECICIGCGTCYTMCPDLVYELM